MSVLELALCYLCKHFDRDKFTCKAYPEGIPRRFLAELDLHLKPWKQENDIVFEKRDDIEEELVELAIKSKLERGGKVPE